MKNTKVKLEIIFEDNHVLAVVKPAGLPAQRDRTGDPSLNDLVKEDLKRRFKKPGNVYATAVHRLDRPASGIVLIAKTEKAAARLSAAFREKSVRKTYLAVVEGKPPAAEATLQGWLIKDAARNTSRMALEGDRGAKSASLTYRVLGGDGDFCLLEVDLETGRGHQVRVQLSDAGMPVAGDRRYGAKSGFGPMIALHAARIAFPHPVREEEITLYAPPPQRWTELFGQWVFDLITQG